ncbi:MAG TPA: hypothetical protein VJA19_03630 [Pseudomonas sp.]|nr:hypothetical protein [Pseudomonas sp.]
MEHNPYSAPRVELLEPLPVVALERWSARHLSLLAWLTLVSLLGTLVVLGFGLVAQRLELGAYQPAIDGLSLALTALGCYLLLRLKAFAEARFAAKHLAWPVGCAVVGYGALGIFEHGVDEVAMASLNWQAFVYLGLMLLAGGLTLWLGIRLLMVEQAYPVFRLMAWLDIASGICLLSVVLMMVAVLPLLGGNVAMMLVFFKGAAEQRGLQKNPG